MFLLKVSNLSRDRTCLICVNENDDGNISKFIAKGTNSNDKCKFNFMKSI